MRKYLLRTLLLSTVVSAGLIAQSKYAADYLSGLSAFQAGDLDKAEQLFLNSISTPGAPKNRGASVLLEGQQFGFYPELYLVQIYARQQRHKDVLKYVEAAKKSIKRSDPMYSTLDSFENEARKALAPGQKTDTRGPTLTRPAAEGGGKMYALVIGVEHYKDPAFKQLQTPISDATDVRNILRENFGFEADLLKDATRYEIMTALEKIGRAANEAASVLIYYGGHGVRDPDNLTAYWLPRDADESSRANWISSNDITNTIRAFRARHVLVVSDSCYAGALTRVVTADVSKSDDHDLYVERAAQSPSRTLLASGGDEPVYDAGGGDNHSIFAGALLRGLKSFESARFTAHELFQNRIAEPVAGGSRQLPQYSPIRDSGHVDGDFVFYRR